MCCGKIATEIQPEAEWWQYVRAGSVLTTFGSEEDALAFLALGIENVQLSMKPTYMALEHKRAMAGWDPNVCAICGQHGTWAFLDVPVCYRHCELQFAGERKRLAEERWASRTR